jgi:tetratricopeptide (TPR) repeat protein
MRKRHAGAYDLIGTGLGHADIDKLAEEKAAYDEAIRLQPDEPIFRYHRYQLLKRHGFQRDALQEADAILGLTIPTITKPFAVTYYGKLTSFRTAVALERASLLLAMGRINESQTAYDQSVQNDPSALTFAWRAQFHLAQSAPMNVVQDNLDKSLAFDPAYWFSRDLQARVHFYSEQYEAAAAEYARAIELYPINGTMRWWHALTLRKLGRFDDASAEAVTAFQVDPGFMINQIDMLRMRGYLPTLAPNAHPIPALYDAARACMLDEGCG